MRLLETSTAIYVSCPRTGFTEDVDAVCSNCDCYYGISSDDYVMCKYVEEENNCLDRGRNENIGK